MAGDVSVANVQDSMNGYAATSGASQRASPYGRPSNSDGFESQRPRRATLHACQGVDSKWECRFCISRVSPKSYLIAHTRRDHEGFSGCEDLSMVSYLADMTLVVWSLPEDKSRGERSL